MTQVHHSGHPSSQLSHVYLCSIHDSQKRKQTKLSFKRREWIINIYRKYISAIAKNKICRQMYAAIKDYVELGNQHPERQMSQRVSHLHSLLQIFSFKCHSLFKNLVFTVNGNCYRNIINVHNAEVNVSQGTQTQREHLHHNFCTYGSWNIIKEGTE